MKKNIHTYLTILITSQLTFLVNHSYLVYNSEQNLFKQIDITFISYFKGSYFILLFSLIPILIFILVKYVINAKIKVNFFKNGLALFLLVYSLLIVLTNSIGGLQIENDISKEYEKIELLKGNRFDVNGDKEILIPWYIVKSYTTYIPFVLAIESGYVIEPLSGEGNTRYYFWLFGFYSQLYEFSSWVT